MAVTPHKTAFGKHLGVLICAGCALTGAVRGEEEFVAGPLYSDYKLTLTPGRRVEAAGPFYFSQDIESQHQIGFPPAMTWTHDRDLDYSEFDLGYPALTYRRYGGEYRFQIFQLLSWAGSTYQAGDSTHRFTLFPVYFRQRDPKDPSKNYTAFVPFYGRLKHRLNRDDIQFTMFPAYAVTRKKDVITYNYFYPFYHERFGNRLYGRQFWPFVGKEVKGITYQTNRLDEVEVVGGHEHFFAGFPFYLHNWDGLGTTNPVETLGVIPFYVRQTSPARDSVSYGWPFGYTAFDDREKKYQERDILWPLYVRAWGEGKQELRIFPFYNRAKNPSIEDDWYMWPVYKVNYLHSPPLERKRTRVFFFLYSDLDERDTDRLASSRRVDFFPFYTARREMNGDRSVQVLSILEPFFPGNKSIHNTYSPIYTFWLWEKKAKTGFSTQSLLWNLYRREASDDSKKISVLFGLFQYESDLKGRSWRICYLPTGKKGAETPAPTH